jgi:anthranilate/para-aminobenzoate synthase component I
VADSVPSAEYDETLAKARGFLAVLDAVHERDTRVPQTVDERG